MEIGCDEVMWCGGGGGLGGGEKIEGFMIVKRIKEGSETDGNWMEGTSMYSDWLIRGTTGLKIKWWKSVVVKLCDVRRKSRDFMIVKRIKEENATNGNWMEDTSMYNYWLIKRVTELKSKWWKSIVMKLRDVTEKLRKFMIVKRIKGSCTTSGNWMEDIYMYNDRFITRTIELSTTFDDVRICD